MMAKRVGSEKTPSSIEFPAGSAKARESADVFTLSKSWAICTRDSLELKKPKNTQEYLPDGEGVGKAKSHGECRAS